MISFDTPQVFQQKAEFIKHMGLAGAGFWETSGDYNSSSSNGKPTIPMVLKMVSTQLFDDLGHAYSRWDTIYSSERPSTRRTGKFGNDVRFIECHEI